MPRERGQDNGKRTRDIPYNEDHEFRDPIGKPSWSKKKWKSQSSAKHTPSPTRRHLSGTRFA
jgi:hypothetical protein